MRRRTRSRRSLRSARGKIRAVLRSTMVSVLALGLVGLSGLGVLSHVLEDLVEHLDPASWDNARILQLMTDTETAIRGYELTRDPSYLEPFRSASAPRRDAESDLAQRVAGDPALAGLVGRQRELTDRWLVEFALPIAVGGGGPQPASRQRQAKAVFDEFRAVTGQITDRLEGRRQRLVRLAEITVALSAVAVLVTVALELTIGLRPGRRALRGIASPLEHLQEVVHRMKAGDQDAWADPEAGVLEIQAVARALNELALHHRNDNRRTAQQLRLATTERDFGFALHAATDLGDVLQRSVAELTQGFDASTVWIRVAEADDQPGCTGQSAMYPRQSTWRPPRHLVEAAWRLAVTCWNEQRTLLLDRDTVSSLPMPADEVRQILELVEGAGGRSLMFAPVGAGPDCLGYLAFTRSPELPPWTGPELDAAQRVAKDIGRTVLNKRLHAREQQLVRELQALDATRNTFVSMVSHELRTPLAAILGHLEIIRTGDLGEISAPIDKSLDAIQRNSTRLTSLIEDLLLLSRIEEGTQPTTKVLIDLGDVAREAGDLLAPLAERAKVSVGLQIAEPPPELLGDPYEIERLVTNLLSNAIKFSPPQAAVEVCVSTGGESGELAMLTVADHGLGISEADQAQLFTRFFRSTNPSALRINGTGLGLAIARIIVERHHGRIGVQSRLGEGTTFTVELPLHQPVPARSALDAAGSAHG